MDATLITSLVLGSILLALLLVLLVRRTVVATVAGFSWQRRVELEQYVWVEDSSYSGYPQGSRNQHSKRETYFTNEITSQITTTTTNADGTPSTTTQPVYQMVPHWRTKYLYEIQRWRKSRELRAEGGQRTGVHWPAYTLDAASQERVQDRHEHYQIIFETSKGKRYTCELPENEWAALDEQPTYRVRVTLFGKATQFVPDPALAVGGGTSGKAK
jgi:hypothetical protein